ncbi:hypothetical protein FISHEDRAFT_10660, partial [Fistulina hepatica ATCC 64428]
RLGLSYHNTRRLHQKIESIPSRAGIWKTILLSFPDNPEEKFTVRHRDPVEAVRSLWQDPTFAEHIVYLPEHVFTDETKQTRRFNEMWTGRWWGDLQDDLPDGATIAAVILASDKTLLTQFTGGKSAYPLYLTLGNIPKWIRHCPSMQPCILIGYLPVEKVSRRVLTEQVWRARTQRVFHEAMRHILKPLTEAGKKGIPMAGADGMVRHVYPIVAAHASDYQERCLVSCTKNTTCPNCQCPTHKLSSSDPRDMVPRTCEWTLQVIAEAK